MINLQSIPFFERGLQNTYFRYLLALLLSISTLVSFAAEVDSSPIVESTEIVPNAESKSQNELIAATPAQNNFSSASLPNRISIKTAIELARNNSPQLKHHSVMADRQKLNADLADLNYSPDFDVQVSANSGRSRYELDGYDEKVRRNLNSVTLQATMPWWYKAEYKFDQKIAEIGQTLQTNNYESNFRRLDVDIYIAYFDAVLQQNKIHVQKTLANVSKQRLDNTIKSYGLGRASQWSKVNDESNYLTQLAALKRSETDLLQKVIRLSNLIGLPLAGELALADDQPLPLESDLAKVLNLEPSFAADPNLREIALQLQQKQLEVQKIDKTAWKPKLTFKASYADENQFGLETEPDGIFENAPPGQDASQVMVGATLNVPIPTFSEHRLKKRYTLSEIEDLKSRMSELKRARLADIANKKAALKLLSGQLATYSQLVKMNADKAEFARESFEIGKLTGLELQNIESLQVKSAEEYYETLFSQRRNYAELCWLLNAPID